MVKQTMMDCEMRSTREDYDRLWSITCKEILSEFFECFMLRHTVTVCRILSARETIICRGKLSVRETRIGRGILPPSRDFVCHGRLWNIVCLRNVIS